MHTLTIAKRRQGIHMETRWTVRLCVPAVVLMLMPMGAFSAPAQTFDEAVAAYERGDYAAAYRGFRVHAEQGGAAAQFNLGLMYHHGQGVPQDYAEAMTWFRRAADQGRADAQYSLGLMYHKREGVPQDFVQAHMWLNLAASRLTASEKDFRQAVQRLRDEVASRMTPADLALAQRLAREWRPKTESGSPRAAPTSGK